MLAASSQPFRFAAASNYKQSSQGLPVDSVDLASRPAKRPTCGRLGQLEAGRFVPAPPAATAGQLEPGARELRQIGWLEPANLLAVFSTASPDLVNR